MNGVLESALVVLSRAVLAGGVLLAGIFALTCLRERQWRGAAIVAALALLTLCLLAALLLAAPQARPWVQAALPALALVLTLLIALPFGSRQALRIVGEPERVDERDALFHRFYRLEPGSAEFELYYRDHPEKAELDQQVRALPALSRPGSRSFDALTSPMMHATFDVIERGFDDVDVEPLPLDGRPVSDPPEELSRRIRGFARYLGADLVGCTRLNPAHVYSHIGRGPGRWGQPIVLEHTHAIAIAVQMDHDMVRHAPRLPTVLESASRYLEGARIASVLARTIGLLGYSARAHLDGNYRVMCVPIAVDAGLGELGRIGLLVTPSFGPRVRLSVVTTDLPLAQDAPLSFGVQQFCTICKKCADCCPSDSIASGEKVVQRGVEKWVSRQDSCYHYWRRCGTDCGICLKVCPYSHPSSLAHDMVRKMIRQNPLARRLALWGDDLLYGRRPRGRFLVDEWLEPGGDRPRPPHPPARIKNSV